MSTAVQPTDPGATGAGSFWLTPDGVLSVRNAANTGWTEVCTAGFDVPFCSGPSGTMSAGPMVGTSILSTESMRLYDGATYLIRYTCTHASDGGAIDCNLNSSLSIVGGGQVPATQQNMGHTNHSMDPPYADNPSVVQFSYIPGVVGNPCYKLFLTEGGGYAGCNCHGAVGDCVIIYLSGPDPRFINGPVCA